MWWSSKYWRGKVPEKSLSGRDPSVHDKAKKSPGFEETRGSFFMAARWADSSGQRFLAVLTVYQAPDTQWVGVAQCLWKQFIRVVLVADRPQETVDGQGAD